MSEPTPKPLTEMSAAELAAAGRITDDHGSFWRAECPHCGGEMGVLRPGWAVRLDDMAEGTHETPLCPQCKRDAFVHETILPNGELGCACRLDDTVAGDLDTIVRPAAWLLEWSPPNPSSAFDPRRGAGYAAEVR